MSVDAARRRTMQAVKSANTGPEKRVRQILTSEGFRYRLHYRDLPGKPDIVFPGKRKVIVVHGCFWHNHSCERGKRVPKTNTEYWVSKRERNAKRDRSNRRLLSKMGWQTLTVWECQLVKQEGVTDRLVRFVNSE